jgi:membrane fusion protein (multidrug efflux system)
MSPVWKRLIGALLLCGCISGCEQIQARLSPEKKAEEESAKQEAPAPEVLIPVEAVKPERRSISDYFETTSRVMAERRVEVVSKGLGQCVEVLADEGDVVKEGQVLARLDRKELEAQLRQMRVTLQMNEYQMNKAREQQAKGILSSFEADNARFAYEQAKATLEVQELQLQYQDIVAPIGGVVTQRVVQRGMVVANGMPVFSIVDPDSFVLPITAPEKELQYLREGQGAEVRVDSAPDQAFRATVRRINPSVDPASGTVRVLLDFEEGDRAQLKDSAFARVKLIMETRENILAVPKDALLEENGRKYLMLLHEPEVDAAAAADADATKKRYIAERTEIQTGIEDSTYIEVTSGLTDNDLFVTLGQHTLKSGAAVQITSAEAEVMANINLTAAEALARGAKSDKDSGGGRGEDPGQKLVEAQNQ